MQAFRPFTVAGLLAGLAMGAPAAAAPLLGIQAGASFMDEEATPAVFLESVLAEHPLGASRFTWAPDFSLGWIDGRNVTGHDERGYTPRESVWLAAAGARLRYGNTGDPHHAWFFSFQPALQRGRTVALSSGYEFISTFGWQGERLSVALRHVSNAGFHEPNLGETMLLVGFSLAP
ncbi:lipid A 3-O-deacylase [Dokdonella sp.]|uniref:lipid A 3-O-deacylase n=1 Tax=Dokdonella sp. TaxID=2291710 RepID=UPI0031C71533|nr:acyloxyacyl hydrolase [Dokdonella sp.]